MVLGGDRGNGNFSGVGWGKMGEGLSRRESGGEELAGSAI